MSTIRANTLADAAGNNASTAVQIQQGRAKVWINFNGTGVIAIRDSFNAASITDSGVGTYDANFTAAFPNTNYAPAKADREWSIGQVVVQSVSAARMLCYNSSFTLIDVTEVYFSADGD